MKRYLNSSSPVFNKQVETLTDALFAYRKFTTRIKRQIEKCGYTVENDGNHFKCFNGKELVTVIACSPSDENSCMQILRNFRIYWEKKNS